MLQLIFLVFFSYVFEIVSGDSLCWVDESFSFQWCEHGCCQLSARKKGCCTFEYAWAIGVGIVGCIIIVVVVVLVVLWCCQSKKKMGRVIGPSDSTQVYSTSVTYSQPYYNTQMAGPQQYQPPPYPTHPPPPYPPPSSSTQAVPYGNSRQEPRKQPPQEADGIQAPPPVDYALPSNHNVV